MSLNRSFSNLLAAAAFTTLLAAPALAAEPIKIGVPVGLSGANSVVAPSVVQSAQLAVEEINAKGGVLGRNWRWKSPMTPRARLARRRRSTASSFRRRSTC